jgi:hypothetical protein
LADIAEPIAGDGGGFEEVRRRIMESDPGEFEAAEFDKHFGDTGEQPGPVG